MNETTIELQSKGTLVKALIGAIVLAAIVFVTVVLPAEYQSDPTGVGKLLGLTVLTQDAPSPITTPVIKQTTSASTISSQQNETTVIVPSHRGIEYKFDMNQHAQITYEWTTDGEPLYFDFHGEPKGDTTGYFLSYTIATATTMKGTMTVPFDGVHGWYWKNTSDNPVTVTLKTSGAYQVKGLIH